MIERGDTTPVEDDPAELQGNGDAHQADAERDEEEHRPTAPRDPHRHECELGGLQKYSDANRPFSQMLCMAGICEKQLFLTEKLRQ